jgi:hypothetical protein
MKTCESDGEAIYNEKENEMKNVSYVLWMCAIAISASILACNSTAPGTLPQAPPPTYPPQATYTPYPTQIPPQAPAAAPAVDYVSAAMPLLQRIADTMHDFGQLFTGASNDGSLVLTPSWQDGVEADARTMLSICRSIRALTPSSAFAATQTELIASCDDSDSGMQSTLAAVTRLRAGDIDGSLPFLSAGTDAILRATDHMNRATDLLPK